MAQSPGNIIFTVFTIVFIIVALSADFGYFTLPSFSNQENSSRMAIINTTNTSKGYLVSGIIAPLTNATTTQGNGFGASLNQFSSLAFQLSSILQVAQILLNVPRLLINTIAVPLVFIGIPNFASVGLSLLLSYEGIWAIFQVAGWYEKAETWLPGA